MIPGRILPRLLLGFLLLSPLPLGGLAWLYTQAFERAVTETVLANLSSIADKKVDQINSYLDERILDGQMLAKSPATHQALRTLPKLLVTGEGAASAPYRAEETRYRDGVGGLFDLGNYHDVLLIDAAGMVVYSVRHEADFASNLNTGPYRDSTLGMAQREALAFLDTRTTSAQPYAASGGRPAIFIVTPVMQGGRPLGSVALQLDLDQLSAVTTDTTGLGETGETVLAQVEEDGILYVAPLRHVPNAAFHYRVAKQQIAHPMKMALSGNHGGGVAPDYAGIAVAAAWRYLPALNWSMVVKTDVDEALAPALRMRRFSLGALALLLLISTAAAAMFGRALVAPIRRLTSAAQSIAAGELDQRAPVKGSEEFRKLAESFNRMADRIAEGQALLEQRVEERTRALNDALVQAQRFRDALDQVSAYIYMKDLNHRYVYANRPTLELFRVSATELPGSGDERFFPPATAERLHALDDRVFAGEQTAEEIDVPAGPDSGRVVYWEIKTPLYADAEQKTVVGLCGISTDITERKLAEQELHRASSYNRSLIEASVDPLVTIGPDGKITDVNAATEAATGYARDQLIGTEFSDYFSDPDKARAGYRQVFRDGHVRDYELEIRHRDGSLTPVLYNATVYRDDAGTVIGVFAAARDIAQRRKAEEAVRQLNAELEQRVAQRTAQLLAANKELEDLSYSMSHDMRTPLRAVHGFSRILLEEHGAQLGEEGRRLQSAIGENAARMGRLIDDILLFLHMGKRRLTAGPVDLASLAREEFARILESMTATPSIQLKVGAMPPAWGDRDMLRQVMRNLLSNAVKFSSPDREPVVEIDGVTEGNEHICRIKDNGIGFDMRYVGKLFKVFERVHSTGRYEGTAIGLAIVKRIVERHGGRVWAEGQVGAGATFYFALPQPPVSNG